jgi:hypothetical protein
MLTKGGQRPPRSEVGRGSSLRLTSGRSTEPGATASQSLLINADLAIAAWARIRRTLGDQSGLISPYSTSCEIPLAGYRAYAPIRTPARLLAAW